MSKSVKKVEVPAWKTMDIKKVSDLDLRAAIQFLCIIRDNPKVFDALTDALEDLRAQMVKAERANPPG